MVNSLTHDQEANARKRRKGGREKERRGGRKKVKKGGREEKGVAET